MASRLHRFFQFRNRHDHDGLKHEMSIHDMERASVRAHWGSARVALADALESNVYQCLSGLLVGAHAILIIQETDLRAAREESGPERKVVGYVFLALYSIDLFLRLHAYRRSFFQVGWNRVDFFVVALDYFSLALTSVVGDLPSFAVLRLCRISRLARLARFLRLFKELDIMLTGFVSAMRAMFWATLMLVVILTFFSIIAVELVHPIGLRLVERGVWSDCERCQRAFSSVLNSNLTFLQQIVAGDSWGLVSVPIIEEEPLAALFLVAVLVVVQFGVMNLVLTVIVDVANSARQADEMKMIIEKAAEHDAMKKKLMKLCEELDTDGSGELSMHEFMEGMEHNAKFAQQMAIMDINEDDMAFVFNILDKDKSGAVHYSEFVDQLHKMKSQDDHKMLIFMRCHLNEVRNKVTEDLQILKDHVVTNGDEMVNSLRKILSGGPILTGGTIVTKPVSAPVTSDGTEVAQAMAYDSEAAEEALASCAGVCREPGKADEASSKAEVPVRRAISEPARPVAGQACPQQGIRIEPFSGLLRFEEMLLQIEKQVGEQLVLLQDWGPPAWPAVLSMEEAGPCSSAAAEAKAARLEEAEPLEVSTGATAVEQVEVEPCREDACAGTRAVEEVEVEPCREDACVEVAERGTEQPGGEEADAEATGRGNSEGNLALSGRPSHRGTLSRM